jgi:hypothetical protein
MLRHRQAITSSNCHIAFPTASHRVLSHTAPPCRCGVLTEGTGFFRASTIVKWLLVQALATSREQAVPMCEAMRRQGLILPVGDPTPFADGAALYRFPADLP